jgi:superfamily II DNA or RNA helicase
MNWLQKIFANGHFNARFSKRNYPIFRIADDKIEVPPQIDSMTPPVVPEVEPVAAPQTTAKQTLFLVVSDNPNNLTIGTNPAIGDLITQQGKRLSPNWTVNDYNFDSLKIIKHNIVKGILSSLQSFPAKSDDWVKSNVIIDRASNLVVVPKSLSMIVKKKPVVLSPNTAPAVMASLQLIVSDITRTLQNYRVDASVEVQNAIFPESQKLESPSEQSGEQSGYNLKFEFIKNQYEPDYHFRINLREEFSIRNFRDNFQQWRDIFLNLVTKAIFCVPGAPPKKIGSGNPVVFASPPTKYTKKANVEPESTFGTSDGIGTGETQVSYKPEYISPKSFNMGSAERRKQAIVDARQDLHYYDDRDSYLYLRGSWNAYGRFAVLLNNQFDNQSLKDGLSLLMKSEEQEGRAGLRKNVRTIRAGVSCVNSMADNYVQDNWKRDENFNKVYYPDVFFDENGQPHRPGDKPGRKLDLFQRTKDPLKLDERTGLPKTDIPRFMHAIKDYAIRRRDPRTGKIETYWPKLGHKRTILTMYSNQRNICGDDTGLGKTSEYIMAADMRTNEENAANIARTFGNSSGRVLVITLAMLVKPFNNSIVEILGEQASISNDPGNRAKWTVMSYDTFRSDPKSKQMQLLVKSVTSQCYDVLILDEAHVLKNPNSNRSRNIAAICDYIPFVWMGSATISANRPVDIHHPLKMLGHPLGQLSQAEFMRQYTEMTSNNPASQYVDQTRADNQIASVEGYDIANVPAFLKEVVFPSREYKSLSSVLDRIQYAQKASIHGLKSLVDKQVGKIMDLSAMLILTNVYTRQTKEDVWKEDASLRHPGKSIEDIDATLPKHIEHEILVPPQQIGRDALQEINQEAMHSADPKGFAIVRKIKIAEKKVPITISHISNIWAQSPNPEKILVFTGFHESGRLLAEGLGQKLSIMFPGQNFKCIRAVGPDINIENRQSFVDEFKQNPAAKALVLGIESGGTGIDVPNITSHCFFNDLPWTPRAIVQAKGRIYRMNTKDDVNIYYVAVDGTPDKMYAASLKKKEALANMVQGINKAYADKVQNHQDTSEEVARSREIYWDLVMDQVRDAVIANEYIKTGIYYDITRPTTNAHSSSWLRKAIS